MTFFDEKPTGKLRWQPKFGMRCPPNGLPQQWCQLQYQHVWYDLDGEAHYEWIDVPIGGANIDD